MSSGALYPLLSVHLIARLRGASQDCCNSSEQCHELLLCCGPRGGIFAVPVTALTGVTSFVSSYAPRGLNLSLHVFQRADQVFCQPGCAP